MTETVKDKTAVKNVIKEQYQRDVEIEKNITDPLRKLDYEEAVKPLKYVPELALQVGTWTVGYREPDELYRISTGEAVHPFEIRAFLESESTAVRPVLVVDTVDPKGEECPDCGRELRVVIDEPVCNFCGWSR